MKALESDLTKHLEIALDLSKQAQSDPSLKKARYLACGKQIETAQELLRYVLGDLKGGK